MDTPKLICGGIVMLFRSKNEALSFLLYWLKQVQSTVKTTSVGEFETLVQSVKIGIEQHQQDLNSLLKTVEDSIRKLKCKVSIQQDFDQLKASILSSDF